ncbi:hypothetical protein SCHPADRAFT_470893 [Schizopora paradoxa]|uniref:PLP-dependent transferase n=1 Tax=Schizopora paradoxa TaxID=27342 RepID=A0A0H2S3G4_9AGAM|nr:hypothetical protein SCHPADRAFT_470893 [Schizopora paradoxa]
MMDIEQFRKAGYEAIDRICDFYYRLEQKNVVADVEPGYLQNLLPAQAPEDGEDFKIIADEYQRLIVPGLTLWQHPSFFAYFPTACTFEGMLADLYASSACNPGFNWICSPACTELEVVVCDWAAKLLGLDKAFWNESKTGGGVIQTTASDSVLVATVAARSRYIRANPDADLSKLVIYVSSQTHSAGAKAALILGLTNRILDVTLDDNLALRGSTLRAALEEDMAAGKHPFILIATVGTTSTGAIDKLPEIFEVANDFPSLWVHIDAAWAGLSLVCPENRELCYLDRINKSATSFCTNFHKWGLTNFDCSVLWVRNRIDLTEALDITPTFLRSKHGDAGTVIDYRNWHLGLGRRFRSLKLWFVLRSYGVRGFQSYIRKGINLNRKFASLVRSSSEIALVTQPSLALSVFHVNAPMDAQDSISAQNSLTTAVYESLSARKDIQLTQTSVQGLTCIRFAVGAARTEERHIEKAFAIILEETKSAIRVFKMKGAP